MTKQSGIIRRPDFAGGGLTDEEMEKMAAHSALWTRRAFRTEPADQAAIEDAINGLYRAANLAEPRVILVPSPFVMAMAGGIASVWWCFFKNNPQGCKPRRVEGRRAAPFDAPDFSIYNATRAATDAASYIVTFSATNTATFTGYDAAFECAGTQDHGSETDDTVRGTSGAIAKAAFDPTYYGTKEATDSLTHNKTYGVTNAEIFNATTEATYDATMIAIDRVTGTERSTWLDLAAEFVGQEWAPKALEGVDVWEDVAYRSGGMNPFDECALTAFRDILGLRLPSHEAYAYWEKAAINGGFRWMHSRFCLVSDFPEVVRVNARNQPHAEFGPSLRWRDGLAIWHLNGVRVEQWMAESHLDDIDARRVLQEENVDQRRELIRRMGLERLVGQLQPAVLDTEQREVGGEYRLLAVEMNHGEPWRFLQMVNQSIGAVHIEAVPRECRTVREALNWRRSQNIDHDWFPIQLT